MATKVLVPRLGEGVDELTIVKWLKQEGQQVSELDPLVEVETDKVVTEIPSPATGTLLRIVIPENSPARVGDAMALIGQPGETLPSEPGMAGQVAVITGLEQSHPQGGQQNPVTVKPPSAGRDPGSTFLSPVVRKMAAEQHIDLSQVQGSGLNGRITRQDVQSYLEHPSVKTGVAQSGTGQTSSTQLTRCCR